MKTVEKKNPHWSYRRFPSIDECEQNLQESKDAVVFWTRMRDTVRMMNGDRLIDSEPADVLDE